MPRESVAVSGADTQGEGAAPAAPSRAQPATVELTTPIQAHGEEVHALTLRPPLGKDIRVIGFPFAMASVGGDTETRFDAKVISRYVVELAGVPLSSVDQLSAADWVEVMGAVTSFFGQSGLKSSRGSTTRPGSGEA